MNSTFAIALALPAALLTGFVARAHDGDQDRVRAAVERGEIRPLAEILDRVRAQLPGEIVGTEIEQERSRWTYEFRLLGEDGHLRKAHVDAATGAILEIKEK